MDFKNSVIGQNIKTHRKALKMKQTELANKINKTESSIRKYEKGIVTIPLNVLEEIANALNVTTFDLMSDEKALAKEVHELEAFLTYLESIGYTVDTSIEGNEGESYSVYLTKDGIKTNFTKAEFENFQFQTKRSVDYQVWLKAQEKK